MADNPTRSAAKVSALIAVPLAVIVGAVVFFSFYGKVNAATKPATTAAAASPAATASVPMDAPSLSAAHAQACLAVIAALPTSIRGLTERHVAAGAQQNAAFGDPAVTIECGAPKAVVAPTDDVLTLSNVCYHAVTTSTGSVFTTVDREVPIAITVPAKYDAAAQWAVVFSPAIVQGMPTAPTTYNC